ncbi:MAG: SpoIIE family protein phosphatase [bacterium]|nr:SpoIIE family protein phosphatase [bacterium]
MRKKRKPKLAVLFIIGLLLVLILLSAVLTFVSIGSVRNLGDYAVKIDRENNDQLSSELFLKLTNEASEGYSNRVKLVATFLNVFSENVLSQLRSNSSPKKSIKMSYDFKKYPNRNFSAYLLPEREFDLIYFGDKNEVPQKVISQADSISDLLPACKKIVNENQNLMKSVWVFTTDKLEFCYPAYLPDANKIPYLSSINKFYERITCHFPLKSNDPNEVSPVIIYSPLRNLYYEGVIDLYMETSIYDNECGILAYVGVTVDFNKIQRELTKQELYTNSELLAGIDNRFSKDSSFINKKQIKGFMFLMDQNGSLITFSKMFRNEFSLPKGELIPKNSQINNRIKLIDSKNPDMRKLENEIKKNKSGVINLVIKNEIYTVAFSKIDICNWTLGYIVNQKSLLHPVLKTRGKVKETVAKLSHKFILISIIFLVLSFLTAFLFFRRLFLKPIRKIINGIEKISEGDFDVNVNEYNTSEIAELSMTFNFMGKKLRDYMENLKDETAVRQSIETEIKLAENIQNSILPSPHLFPTAGNFELSARINAAKSISGDFYDFFYISDNKLAVLIGDVSGKGIPAAFFMAMSKSHIKNCCMTEPDLLPGEVLGKVNNTLSLDNNAQMFTTVSLMFYNIEDNIINYSSAGHHASLMIRNEEFIKIEKVNSIALGILEDAVYPTKSIQSQIGDTCISYTDGIFEAVSPNGVEYGEERLKNLIKENINLQPDKLCDCIFESVERFEGVNRFDDITVIIFRRIK